MAITNNSLQMGQAKENQASPAGTFGVWGFVGKLCPKPSSGATLKLLRVCLGCDFTWQGPVRSVRGAQLEAGVLFLPFHGYQKNTASARRRGISLPQKPVCITGFPKRRAVGCYRGSRQEALTRFGTICFSSVYA